MIDIASKWIRPVMVRMYGGEDNYRWFESKEYKALEVKAQLLSPGKRIWDKRTKAYKYMKWHEPRARAKWSLTEVEGNK